MKTLVTLVLIVCALNSYSQIEFYSRYTIGGSVEPDINIYGEKKISPKFNLTYFAMVEEKWSEALVGFSYSPLKWMTVGLSTGIEHNPAIYRFGGSLWLGNPKTNLLSLVEQGKGKDNYWYKICLSKEFLPGFRAGLMAWRFHGIGPMLNYNPKKSDLTFWILPCHDFEYDADRVIIGVNIKI